MFIVAVYSPEGKIFLTLSLNYPLFTSRMCSRVKRNRRKQVSYGISQNIKNVIYSNWIRPPIWVLLKDVRRHLARVEENTRRQQQQRHRQKRPKVMVRKIFIHVPYVNAQLRSYFSHAFAVGKTGRDKSGRYRNYRENNAERPTGWEGVRKRERERSGREEKFSKNEVI